MDPPPPKRRRNDLSKEGSIGIKKRPRRNFSDASETITSSSDEEMDHLTKRVKMTAMMATRADGDASRLGGPDDAQDRKSSSQGSVVKMMQVFLLLFMKNRHINAEEKDGAQKFYQLDQHCQITL